MIRGAVKTATPHPRGRTPCSLLPVKIQPFGSNRLARFSFSPGPVLVGRKFPSSQPRTKPSVIDFNCPQRARMDLASVNRAFNYTVSPSRR